MRFDAEDIETLRDVLLPWFLRGVAIAFGLFAGASALGLAWRVFEMARG